jgi:hypothetical protein
MRDHSKILNEAYQKFLLPIGEKLIPTPYRENDRGGFQDADPEFQGKSSPEVLIRTTKKLAKKQNFNLEKASVDQIRDFMIKNKLGIDCSGFIYRVLNYLTQEIKGEALTSLGFEHVGRTNVRKLTSDEMSIPVSSFKDAQPGDLIHLRWREDPKRLHAVIVLSNENGIITYAHSSEVTTPDGVHIATMKASLPEDLKAFLYNKKAGDGIRRLKILV